MHPQKGYRLQISTSFSANQFLRSIIMAEIFQFPKYTTRDGNTFSSVLDIFTKDWEVTEQTTTAVSTPTTKMKNENEKKKNND